MKRTVEKTLAWIGIGFQITAWLFFGFMFYMVQIADDEMKQGFSSKNNMSLQEFAFMFPLISLILILGFVIKLALLGLAIMSAFWINQKTKAAAVILIVIGVISTTLSNSISGLCWVISGITLLVRKPKPVETDEALAESEHHKLS